MKNLYGQINSSGIVYIHYHKENADKSLKQDQSIKNQFERNQANTTSMMSQYRNLLKSQLKIAKQQSESSSIIADIADNLDDKFLIEVLDATAEKMTKQLEKDYQMWFDSAKRLSKAGELLLKNQNLLGFINALNLIIQQDASFDGSKKALIKLLNEKSQQGTLLFSEKELQRFSKQRDKDFLRQIQSIFQQYNTYLGADEKNKKSIADGFSTMLKNDLISTKLGEPALGKALTKMEQVADEDIRKELGLQSSIRAQSAGTKTLKESGGMGKTDIRLKNFATNIRIGEHEQENNYIVYGDVELSVKTYMSLGWDTRGKVSIQSHSKFLDRVKQYYQNCEPALYNTLAFSNTKNEAMRLDSAKTNFRLIRRTLIDQELLRYLTGGGAALLHTNTIKNFAPFIAINGRVYSTLSILQKSYQNSGLTADDSIAYIAASAFSNAWEKDEGDSFKPSIEAPWIRSMKTQQAIDKISMTVKLNLKMIQDTPLI